MIKHTVTFKIRDEVSSAEKNQFFNAVDSLKAIPGVKRFEILKNIDKDNNCGYAIFMEFENNDIYHAYSNSSAHLNFIKNYWLKYVETFKEMDFDIV